MDGRDEKLKRLYAKLVSHPDSPITSEDAAKLAGINAQDAKDLLEELSSWDHEIRGKYRCIEKISVKGDVLYQYFTPDSINKDAFRDYDYRSPQKGGIDFSPKRVGYLVNAWIDILEDHVKKDDLTNNKIILIAKDGREIPEGIMETEAYAARMRGYSVVNISADNPSCISDYSWAAKVLRPAMSIFNTASHITRPKEDTVMGAKVAILQDTGDLNSLTTHEIKVVSYNRVKELVASGIAAKEPGPETITRDVSSSHTNMVVTAGLAAASCLDKDIYDIDEEIRKTDDIEALVASYAKLNTKPFSGFRIVIEGAHTISGPLARDAFKELGADVTLLHPDIRLVSGPHKADPSVRKNLDELFETMDKTNAHLGMAFDLDGDRGAVVAKTKEGEFVIVSPDMLAQVLMPFLHETGGYSRCKKLATVRDCLSSDALKIQADQLGWNIVTTDAGYPFLKFAVKDLVAEGYVVPQYQEKSGHSWTRFTGAFENPIVVVAFFTAMIKKFIDSSEDFSISSMSKTTIMEVFDRLAIPFESVPRYQPLFTDHLIQKVASLPENDTGWTPGNSEIPTKIIALARSESIKMLMERFEKGRVFETFAGKVEVLDFETQWDEAAGIYRFGKISLGIGGELIGSFVTRASSNDPTAVQIFEAKEFTGSWDGKRIPKEKVRENLMIIGGLILDESEKMRIINVADLPGSKNMEVVVPIVEEFRKRSDPGNS